MLVKAPTMPYLPIIVIPSDKVPHECWLAWRRTGIGGSDVAKVLGICPFGTARDLYYSKKGIVDASDEESNKWQKRIGHVLEHTVAEMFSEVTGYPIFRIPYMFRSPEHPFMLADVDFFVILPDGSIAILEIKTTSPDNTGKWWNGRIPIIPRNYEYQGRQYMAVMKLNKVFYACLHGNSENYLIIREMDRDLVLEDEMVFHVGHFWNNHVLADVPPPYVEDGSLCVESVRRHHGPADPQAPHVVLPEEVGALLPRFITLNSEKNAFVNQAESELKRIRAIITDHMGTSCTASCVVNGQEYAISFNSTTKQKIGKANLEVLQSRMPDVFDEYVTYSEERRFYVKPAREAAA